MEITHKYEFWVYLSYNIMEITMIIMNFWGILAIILWR